MNLHTHPKMERDLGVPPDHVIIDRETFDEIYAQVAKAKIVVIKDESYPPGYPTPPSDREEWVPGLFGLRFSKWLRKWRKTL